MTPAYKRFIKRYASTADAISRLEIDQTLREKIADVITESLEGQPDFMPDTFRLIASDPLCLCAGSNEGPCPDAREIRVAMHHSGASDGRAESWKAKKPVVRCVSCGAEQFLGKKREAA